MRTLDFYANPFRRFYASATVDAVVPPGHTLGWQWWFEPEHVTDDLIYLFEDNEPPSHYLNDLEPGYFLCTATDGLIDADHPITITWWDDDDYYNNYNNFHTIILDAAGASATVDFPPGHFTVVELTGPGSDAVVTRNVLYVFTDYGYPLAVFPTGHTLTVLDLSNDRALCPGVLTAHATLYDADNQVIATSNACTLTIVRGQDAE